jgi:steroid 5-alpha reductase family enzyme
LCYHRGMISHIFWSVFAGGIAQSIALIAGYMTLFFLYALLKGRNDIADVAWGLGFVAIAWLNFYQFGFYDVLIANFQGSVRFQVLVVVLAVTVWGIRLSTHIFIRNKDKEEDYRYKKWRLEWGDAVAVRSFFQIFFLQGALMLMIALPVIGVTVFGGSGFSWLFLLGFLTWLKGMGYEAVADYQLSKFIKNPLNQGKVMTHGIWSLTRHPNYFGEVLVWWGVYLMALPTSLFVFMSTWPIWVVCLIGPITITTLILKVSGVPLTEKRMDSRYAGNAEYEEYKKRTNTFFPWFPKRG